MGIFKRLFALLILGVLVGLPQESARAQTDSFFDVFTEVSLDGTAGPSGASIDSFFDVFADLGPLDLRCDPCKALEEEIAALQAEIDGISAELGAIQSVLPLFDALISGAEENLENLKKQLEELKNPKNYVESEGRRYDSSDHAAMRRRSANLWQAYKSGDITAQEYSDEVGKPFDDPDVQAELEKIKEQIEEELEEQISGLEQALADAKAQRDALNERASELTDMLGSLLDRLAELMRQLEDCRKRCKLPGEEINIPEDYEIGQEEKGPLESFFDIFTDLFEPDPPVFPDLDKLLGGPIDTEMVPLDLRSLPEQGHVDSFFDVFFEIDLPPVKCHLCDPIRAQIEEMQNALNDLKKQKADVDAKTKDAYEDLGDAQAARDAAKKSLDALNNPRSWAESEGRRMDSSDLAAMRARNARLWGEYKSGDLSAQELSDEWGKPFDDPEVQKELEKIKDQMRDELQETIDKAEDHIEELQQEIKKLDEQSIDLAGSIAVHEVLIQQLLRQLEECEKKCRERDASAALGEDVRLGLDALLEDFDSEDMEFTDDEEDEGSADEETINVPQECISPAVPMSQCQQTCHTTCTKSGVRAWQEGNTVKIEDCGICPPMHIDMCPNGMFFEKAECESAGKCECEEKGKSNDGAACYACKEKKDKEGFGCAIPIIGDWLCGEKEEGRVNVAAGDVNGDGFFCDWFGLFCPDGLDLGDAAECFEGTMKPGDCTDFDANHDGTVNGLDLGAFNFSLQGPSGFTVPLQINGMDGDDTLTPGDLNQFGDCLSNGGPACNGLFVGDPPPTFFGGVPPETILGIGADGMSLHMLNGNDVLLGDPITPNFFGFDGATGFDGGPNPPPLPPDFFNPPPSGPGGGLLVFDPSGNLIPSPPPLPPSTEEQIVQRLIDEVMARLKNEPLGPCEKFVITIIRQRIGNNTRYIARVTKTRDETKCPPESSEQSGCQSDADCDDDDECTQDTCNQMGECTNMAIKDCGDQEEVSCPELSYDSEAGCKEVCREGECQGQVVGHTEKICWFCADKGLQCPQGQFDNKSSCDLICGTAQGSCVQDSKTGCFKCRQPTQQRSSSTVAGERCDAPYEDEASCKQDCFVPCRAAYTRGDGVKCYECPKAETCDAPTETEDTCRKECFGTCKTTYTRSDGVKCVECVPSTTTPPREQCDSPTSELSSCQSSCDGTCEKSYRRGDGVDCYSCKITSTTPSCPSGTVSSLDACQSACSSQGGTCQLQNGCYSCVVVNCPSGTYKNECPSSCSGGCDVAAQQEGTTCYRCKQSCEDLCAQNGFAQVGIDWSSYIQGYISEYSCVSGASISLQTGQVGSCTCSNQPSISIDQTVPICRGTPCGDVACGQSTSCSTGPNETTTVNCNWGGWKKVDINEFVPQVGG